jgi:ABC-type transporter Mla maintaining outer membrane lipid asymmetry ATPase subunit MlaF
MIATKTLYENEERQTQDDVILSISHLYKSFGDNHVLIDFNLELKNGESIVVLGKIRIRKIGIDKMYHRFT